MIVNPKKFTFKKKNALPWYLKLQINNTEITPQSSSKLLGFTIDSELKIDQHISRLCRSAGCQLIEKLFKLWTKESNWKFYICKLWHFCTYKSMNKIESIQKRALQLL